MLIKIFSVKFASILLLKLLNLILKELLVRRLFLGGRWQVMPAFVVERHRVDESLFKQQVHVVRNHFVGRSGDVQGRDVDLLIVESVMLGADGPEAAHEDHKLGIYWSF